MSLLNKCITDIKNTNVAGFYKVACRINVGILAALELGEQIDPNQRKELIMVINSKLAECRLVVLNADVIDEINFIQSLINAYFKVT